MFKTYLRQFARTEELNDRIFDRNISSHHLKLPLSFYGMNTRVTMPITDNTRECEKKIDNNNDNLYITGNDSKNIYYNYASYIDIDSELKNINTPLDNDTDFAEKHIPNSDSDLYLSNYNNDKNVEILKTTGSNYLNSNDYLYNHTRQQLKSL